MSQADDANQWEHLQRALAESYFPHSMEPLSANQAPRAIIKRTELGSCDTTFMSLGAPVSIHSEHPGAYAINITMTGQIEHYLDGMRVSSEAGKATVCPPDTPVVIPRWDSTCTLLGLKVDKGVLERERELVLGHRADSFPCSVDLTTYQGSAWLRMLRSVAREVSDTRGGNSIWSDPRMGTQMGSMIITGLILAAYPSSNGERRGLRPGSVRRVIDAIEADPARSWTPAELAGLTGVGVRRLQQSFREYVGMTPFQYIHEVRIQRVRAELLANDARETVTMIAHRWGVAHLGRFARDYRERFGESPSETFSIAR